VSGIWPPDVGGPATHAPEVADALRARGHEVDVVTTADSPPAAREYAVHALPRTALRHPRVIAEVARRARSADVVYAASMVQRSALGCGIVRSPLVVKLSGDVAYERARRRGLFDGTLDEFQRAPGRALTALRTARTFAVRRAAHVITPSEYLRRIALGWGLPPARVTVLPNPIPTAAGDADRSATFVFAGRLTAAKALHVALAALARVDGASLAIVGDGEQRRELERQAHELGLDGRVRFLGPQPRERVLELFRGAEAVVLSSESENFPHVVVEALAVGTPVIATDVGGVAEVVEDGGNGLLVRTGDVSALSEALQRYLADEELRARLRAKAAVSVARFAPEHVYSRLEEILLEAARI
jgi:glycosyltransferase involved in cell wall biosynthesis